MRRYSRDEPDSESARKPVNFNDETLTVISCKEAVQKDPVCVFKQHENSSHRSSHFSGIQ